MSDVVRTISSARRLAPGRAGSRPRGRLFRKYVLLLVGLVGFVLLVNAAIEFRFAYREDKAAAADLLRDKADSAARRIDNFIDGIERQIGWTTYAQWAANPLEQRRFDFVRLLRQVPAITELTQLDGAGKEQLRVSRLAMDVVSSGADHSRDPAFIGAWAYHVWYGSVYFRKQSEPYMTIAVASAGRNSGVTIAEVNLKLIWDVITALKIGEHGNAYVVDRQGRLIAHPDISLVLRDTDLSHLPQVAAAYAGSPDAATVVDSVDGRRVLTAPAAIDRLGWLVFAELPLAEALAPLYATAERDGALFVLGLALATLSALLLARRMVVPIRTIAAGAARIGAGELDRRIAVRTGDELEDLAGQFNQMAGELQKSYAGLERKVEERTAELKEALDQQTATAEVLGVINSSPGDLAPVFDAILDKGLHLCEAAFGTLWTFDGECFHPVALHRVPAAFAELLSRAPYRPEPGSGHERLLQGAPYWEIGDAAAETHIGPVRRALIELGGARTVIAVPLRKDGAVLGAISAYRREVRPFTDKQIALLQNFAAQAVIAMENARLITETREALEQQTATAEVLGVINSSPGDLVPVFDAMLDRAMRLCEAACGHLYTYDGERFHPIAIHGERHFVGWWRQYGPVWPKPGDGPLGRIAQGELVVAITDYREDEAYPTNPGFRLLVDTSGIRSGISVALRKDDALLGSLHIYRTEVRPFSGKQIALLRNFAAQAVIAMENARLLSELRTRTDDLTRREAELRVTFDNMGDGVAMFDAELRLAAWNRNFQQILDLPDAFLAERPSFAEYFHYLAGRGEFGSADLEAELSRGLGDTGAELRFERTRPDGGVVEVRRNPVPGGGFVLIYSDITERKRAEEQIRAARDAAEAALRELEAAQASLLHAQKMAALGQLTAGIAHEIKNPLNFVNNFAGLSIELLDELKAAAAPGIAVLGEDIRAEIDETVAMLISNLDKIAEHGRRADGIVKSMLLHSRGGSGDWQQVDLNALLDEALNLAYHGARAQDQSFNITLERDLDRALAPIEVVPQDVTRVFLNLIGNGFYATTKRKREAGDSFRPALTVTTRAQGNAVEIRVRDNGTGILPEHRDRLFQPFFTTKPTGEGTGLGLSISYDIVTTQHGGTITVDSQVGEFTEFMVRLPRCRHAARAGRAA